MQSVPLWEGCGIPAEKSRRSLAKRSEIHRGPNAYGPEALRRRREGLDGHRGDRPDAWNRHQARRLLTLPRARLEFTVESVDSLIKLVDPPEQQPAHLGDRLGQARVPVLEHPGQSPDPGPALRSDPSAFAPCT